MKFSIVFAAGLASHVLAFPAIMEEALDKGRKAGKIAKRVLGVNPGFDAAQQLIDVHGSHAWVAPGSRDLRGPCPGLNALANQKVTMRACSGSLLTISAIICLTTELPRLINSLNKRIKVDMLHLCFAVAR